MMFALEFIGLILLIILLIAIPVTIGIFIKDHLKNKRNTKYYIINKTGNIFKEYEDAVTRDKDLKEFNNMGYNFKAHNKIHTT